MLQLFFIEPGLFFTHVDACSLLHKIGSLQNTEGQIKEAKTYYIQYSSYQAVQNKIQMRISFQTDICVLNTKFLHKFCWDVLDFVAMRTFMML